ncbi:MAG: hypothetical protein NTU77_13070 [Actinobacteria bacterium]|nr:hypothetical protein [Actinomycetota bacterium]
MRSPSRPISSLLGAALLASALVAPVLVALPAQAAERSGREVTTYLTIEGRRVVSIDVEGSDTAVSTAGDATFTNGSVALTEGGQPVGAFATKASVVIPDNGGRERRDTTVEVSMPTGALFAQQIQDDPTGRPPDGSSEMVVLGGTGAFRNARGVVSISPFGAQGLKLIWKLAPEIGIDPESATTIAFERIVDADVSGQASNERNALTQDGSQGTLRMPGRDGRFTCGDTRLAQSMPGGIGLDSWLCRYDLPLGSVLVASFTQYRGGTQTPTTFTDMVLGGTGAYAGARGESVADYTSATAADVTLRLLKATGQPPVPVKFNQTRTYKTFGVLTFADESLIFAGATASQSARGTKRSVGTSQSLYATSLDLPPAMEYSRSFGVVSFDLTGGTIRAVAYDEGPDPSIEQTRTLVVTGGTGSYLGATGTIGLIPGKGTSERMVVRLAQ